MIALWSRWREIAAAAGAALALGLLLLWRIEAGHARRLQAELRAAQAAQRSAQAGAAAAAGAAAVVADGAEREAHAQDTHAENSHALTDASGFGQSLDPALNAAGRRGLCNYEAFRASAACIQLRGADPSGAAPAGGADGPAAR